MHSGNPEKNMKDTKETIVPNPSAGRALPFHDGGEEEVGTYKPIEISDGNQDLEAVEQEAEGDEEARDLGMD
jgi:hypothetical protein